MDYIQNRTNWCWIAACKILGEQYKKTHPEVTLSIDRKGIGRVGSVMPEE